MSDTLRCIIADDEPLAVKGIENLVREVPFLTVAATCKDAFEVVQALEEHAADLLFLDIQMPGMTGLQLLKTLRRPPMTIITTAYQKYALEGYELDIVDYLVKPVSPERFLKAVNKAREFYQLREKGRPEPVGADYFFIKCDGRYEKVLYDELLYVEGLKNYVLLHTTTRRLTCYITLKAAEDYLPAHLFLKVHKSFIVAKSKIAYIQADSLRIGHADIPISRQNQEEVLQAIMGDRVLKR